MATLTNLLSAEDSSFEGGTTGSAVVGGNCTIANSTAQAAVGYRSLAITSTGGGDAQVQIGSFSGISAAQVTPGLSYQLNVAFRPAGPVRTVYAFIQWYTPAHGFIVNSAINSGTETPNSWLPYSQTFVAPATSAFAFIIVGISALSGETTYVDNIVLTNYSTNSYYNLRGNSTAYAGAKYTIPAQSVKERQLALLAGLVVGGPG